DVAVGGPVDPPDRRAQHERQRQRDRDITHAEGAGQVLDIEIQRTIPSVSRTSVSGTWKIERGARPNASTVWQYLEIRTTDSPRSAARSVNQYGTRSFA